MPDISQARVDPATGEIYFAVDGYHILPNGELAPGVVDGAGGTINLEGEPIDYGTVATTKYGLGGLLTSSGGNGFTILAGPSVTAYVNNTSGPVTSPATVLSGPVVKVAAAAADKRTILGQPIMIYSVPQIIYITYQASTAFRGNFMTNYPVNRTDFKMVRGVQNEINFYVRDVDRKPVPLASSESLTINIVDPVSDTLLMTRNLTTVDSGQGIYLLTLLPSEMDQWPTAPVNWSISYNRANNTTVILWTDRIYSPYSTVTVVDGPIPGPAPTVTIPGADLMQLSDMNFYTSPLVGAAMYGYANGMQTFTVEMANFSGNIRIDGSLIGQPVDSPGSGDWFEVDLQTYVSNSVTAVLNEQGNFLWMRVVVIPLRGSPGNLGSITQIQYKN